jgi:flagellum-specific peptidoglycan hydrolase FlgJ
MATRKEATVLKYLIALIRKILELMGTNPTNDPIPLPQDKPIKVSVTVPIVATGGGKKVKMEPRDYAAFVKPFTQEIFDKYQIPQIISLTQSAHESGWGNSELTVKWNNYFGMTKGSWTGKFCSYPSTEFHKLPPEKIKYWNRPGDIISKKPDGKGGSVLVVEIDFRAYETPLDSFIDWANHIKNLYPAAYSEARRNNVPGFFAEIGKKYGTDQNYANSCLALYSKVTNEGLA